MVHIHSSHFSYSCIKSTFCQLKALIANLLLDYLGNRFYTSKNQHYIRNTHILRCTSDFRRTSTVLEHEYRFGKEPVNHVLYTSGPWAESVTLGDLNGNNTRLTLWLSNEPPVFRENRVRPPGKEAYPGIS